MGLNASELLGAEQIAGVRVNNRGFNKAAMTGGAGAGGTWGGGAATGIGGMIGGVLMSRWASKRATQERAEAVASTAPSFGKLAFLVLTADELALVGIDAKSTARLTSVLARVPRSTVSSIELAKAPPLISKPLQVTFGNGDVWLLEVPALIKRHATKVVDAFGG